MDPGIYTSHVGYHPSDPKRAIIISRFPADPVFAVRRSDVFTPGGTPVVMRGRLRPSSCVWGAFSTADFSPLAERGQYQVAIGQYGDDVDVSEARCSFPFMVADDVYVKTLRMAFEYFTHQRCGVAVPGYHPVCHLDDAVFRDTGEHRDTTGGWHDAGDLRKWLQFTQMYIYSMLELAERLSPPWNTRHQPWGDVLAEARWGNDYQQKMVDQETGEVYHDVAGGIRGDNSDSRWTDNVVNSGDERHITRVTRGWVHQWWCVATQARMARVFARHDPSYAEQCMAIARLALTHAPSAPTGGLIDDTLGALAHWELFRTEGDPVSLDRACAFARTILACQADEYEHNQTKVRGYLYASTSHNRFYRVHHWSGLPLFVLSTLAEHLGGTGDGPAFTNGIRLMVNDYLTPMAGLNPFGLMPHGLYTAPLAGTGQTHPLAGDLSYRYFNWREASSPENAAHETETFQHGQNSNALSYAVGLLAAERVLRDGAARSLALRQLEWVMGANTHATCFMTGAGANVPFPFSSFAGTIPGGMMNGFIGNAEDTPFLYPGNTLDWNTHEYWGVHAANYVWAGAVMYEGTGVAV